MTSHMISFTMISSMISLDAASLVQLLNLSVKDEKIEIMTRGRDEKGPTWGKEEYNLDQKMERRDAVLEGEKYQGMEDELTQPEQLVKEADDVYAEMAQKRWEQTEMADEDLIEHGVKRLGDLLTTEYFDKSAEDGVFQKIAKPQDDSENDMLDGSG